ncbi:MAG: alpha/beta hydrolase fold domain-containing protein [Hyphomicrobiales bacterium]|nr:alpha/beta hydrolase fold domain-containing protein [Hyphomicrobiales bacterium]
MPGPVEFSATASEGTAVEQLRAALNDIFAQLRAAGGRPADLTAMTWRAARPAAFHPSRRAIDLCYREVFAGFRPPIALALGAGPLTVEARADIVDRSDPRPLWHGYSVAELERQISPRSAAVSMAAVFEQKRRLGAAFRARHPHAAYDLRHGEERDETFDLYYPEQTGVRPLWVFIHGGYWQASDKSDVSDLAGAMLAAGFAVATPNYALCPPATLPAIVDAMRRCLRFLHGHAADFGLDPSDIHIAGTSAGGHLAAFLACDPALAFVRSALAISGLHELEPVALLPAGRILGLDLDTARALSPAGLKPNPGTRVGIAVGELESEEFRRQSAALARQWKAPFLTVKDRYHFNVTDDLATGGALADLACELAGRCIPARRQAAAG